MGCSACPPIKNEEESKQLDETIQTESENKSINPATKKFIIIVSIACLLLFLFIFFGIKLFYPEGSNIPTVEYNGFTFQKMSGLWHTNWVNNGQTYTVSLRYNPAEVEEVPFLGELNESFSKHQVYLTFDPTADPSEFKYTALANAEISLSLVKAFGKEPVAACIKNETEACINRPIVTCEDADKAVILISPNGDPAVLMKDNCVILKGEGLDVLKSADKMLYTWYKIMFPIAKPIDFNQFMPKN